MLLIDSRVRFSRTGEAQVRSMPEAWGLHRALSQGELGVVVEVDAGGPGEPARLCVDFPSGSAHYWESVCFESADVQPGSDHDNPGAVP